MTTSMINSGSVQKIKFFNDFWCVGFDAEKVLNAQEDLERLRDIDNSQSWSGMIVRCKKNYYSKLNTSKKEMQKLNAEMMQFQEL